MSTLIYLGMVVNQEKLFLIKYQLRMGLINGRKNNDCVYYVFVMLMMKSKFGEIRFSLLQESCNRLHCVFCLQHHAVCSGNVFQSLIDLG